MPKSKHRRKPGGRAIAHPGRGAVPKDRPLLVKTDLDDLAVLSERSRETQLNCAKPTPWWITKSNLLTDRPTNETREIFLGCTQCEWCLQSGLL